MPAIIAAHVLDRDQLLLAKIRHNRLLDLALGVLSYSLGSVRRAEVPGTGLIDVEELYVGLPSFGPLCIVPLMIQRPHDPVDASHLRRVEAYCRYRYPGLTPYLFAAQFMPEQESEVVVLFQLVHRDDRVMLTVEKQYRIVPLGPVRGIS